MWQSQAGVCAIFFNLRHPSALALKVGKQTDDFGCHSVVDIEDGCA